MLSIQNLHVSIDGKPIVKGIDLIVQPSEVHAVMGPNGSGKSTLAYALAGHPAYEIQNKDRKTEVRSQKSEEVKSEKLKVKSVEAQEHESIKTLKQESKETGVRRQESGENKCTENTGTQKTQKYKQPLATDSSQISSLKSQVLLDDQDILTLSPDQRAKAGLFLAFQYPVAIPGVTVSSFLHQAFRALHPDQSMPPFKFRQLLKGYMEELGIKEEFANRYLNDGFSGGEKKRIEILQMRVLKPRYAICDETDSGLDIDALKTVAQGIAQSVKEFQMGCLVITHYQRILQYLNPTHVHVMVAGKIVKSGGSEIVKQLEKEGYKHFV